MVIPSSVALVNILVPNLRLLNRPHVHNASKAENSCPVCAIPPIQTGDRLGLSAGLESRWSQAATFRTRGPRRTSPHGARHEAAPAKLTKTEDKSWSWV